MSKTCLTCGKTPAIGNNVSHSHRHTKRRFDPNLQRVRIIVDGHPKNAYVCTRSLKSGRVTKAVCLLTRRRPAPYGAPPSR
jgi:large subunit ribosomal protein L28